MSKTSRPVGPRPGSLTRERIVNAALELLDADGERGLTFRALALKLETGHGAIQWHVENKSELLMAATVTALSRALSAPASATAPRSAIHAIALGVFDAIGAHPWLGPQLFAVPWQPAMVQLWERIGRAVEELGVREDVLFSAVSTLVGYIVGVGGQNAVNTHVIAAQQDRTEFLARVADRWVSADRGEDALITRLADQLRLHDDRTEFLAGIDIIVSGLLQSRLRESNA